MQLNLLIIPCVSYYVAFPVVHKFGYDTLEQSFNLQKAYTYYTYIDDFNGTYYEIKDDEIR